MVSECRIKYHIKYKLVKIISWAYEADAEECNIKVSDTFEMSYGKGGASMESLRIVKNEIGHF